MLLSVWTVRDALCPGSKEAERMCLASSGAVAALPNSWRIMMVMRITPSEAERNAGVFSKATLDKAAHCVRTEGCLILEDIVNAALVIEARDTFVRKYDRYLDGRKHDDALE